MKHIEKYNYWISSPIIKSEFKEELIRISNANEIEDRFYKDLEFGTGGLRGLMGAGTNRMNIHTVSRATQGLAKYLLNKYTEPSVAIAYDSRNNSSIFAKIAATTLCANNIKVYLFDSLRPTPVLSFTVRYLDCSAGIVITASHNPKEYNGYKVYGEDGGQITDETAQDILKNIDDITDYEDIISMDEKIAIDKGLLNYIGEEIDAEYLSRVKSLGLREKLIKEKAQDLKIIYTPLHGTGYRPISRLLLELGFSNLLTVNEQIEPNGDFPTTPSPNPEDREVFKLALELAEKEKPDLIFATDPDSDRIGVVVKDNQGEYKNLTGNEIGMLLTYYIISTLKEYNELPLNPVVIKTIVTTTSIEEMCKENGIEVLDVLTGFKYIGEKIKEYETTEEKEFIFGFEESYGYLRGCFVRDKDAIIAAMLICEMALYYKSLNKSLYDAVIDIQEQYGAYKEDLVSIKLEGKEGQEKIKSAINAFRNNEVDLGNNHKIIKKYDYYLSEENSFVNNTVEKINLPSSNVIKYLLTGDSWFAIRPSGTEPKIKIYLGAKGKNSDFAESELCKLKEVVISALEKYIN